MTDEHARFVNLSLDALSHGPHLVTLLPSADEDLLAVLARTAHVTVSAETYELLEQLAASHGVTASELASILVESGLRPIATLERQHRRAG